MVQLLRYLPASISMKQTPKIIIVHNGKGGVGKTTTTMGLAAIFAESMEVAVVDADEQGSCSWWAERGEMPFQFSKVTDPKELLQLKQIQGYNLVIVDTPPALQPTVVTALIEIADYVVLPSPCAPMDLAILVQTVQEVVAPTKISHRVLLTRVDSRSLREAIDAQNQLLSLGIPTCHSFVRAYKAHERAALDGTTITQAKGKQAREAEADYRRVADELKRDWRN
jgi:chromosome partitioning protein